EMVSARALVFDSKKTYDLMNRELLPTAVQIFGHDPEDVAEAAKAASEKGLFIDINMGCPAPKIVSNGDGCALMKNLPLAASIVRAAVKSSKTPVSVKMRLGWNEDTKNAVELAKICEAEGAFAITVHGRTREQFYSGSADWDEIARIRESVSIQFTANGDVKTARDAKNILDQTGSDSVMIGRGALGNPWIFEETAALLERGEILPSPTPEEKISEAIRHITLLCELKGEYIGIREARKHAAWYISSMKNAAKARDAINQCLTLDEMTHTLQNLLNEQRID
ncbi:MAG: tRNA dihydrouridine synthase DusB, partial [Clostridia bacterium]|nr:tRNA dihydrouridine synthase DusB [Clostridia bacterium]